MGGNENDGYYCTICGGIPPDKIRIKKILVDGKDTGIDHLDWILREVYELDLTDDTEIIEEITRRVRQFNYIPSKKMTEFQQAFLREFKKHG